MRDQQSRFINLFVHILTLRLVSLPLLLRKNIHKLLVACFLIALYNCNKCPVSFCAPVGIKNSRAGSLIRVYGLVNFGHSKIVLPAYFARARFALGWGMAE